MKTRNDFVSNSSSSSFIVIKDTNCESYNFNNQTILIPNSEQGNYEFGWQFAKYDDFWSKLNFCALILISIDENRKWVKDDKDCDSSWEKEYNQQRKDIIAKYDSMKEMLVDVCHNEFHLDIELRTPEQCDCCGGKDAIFAYIDHQSNIFENSENASMFDSETHLINFLTSKDSFIKTGNDNDEGPEGWRDEN